METVSDQEELLTESYEIGYEKGRDDMLDEVLSIIGFFNKELRNKIEKLR